jgi:peptidoglycan hydrolase-like protein with peptidoglycan-binding domain
VYGLRGGVASLRTQSPILLGESATVFGFPLGGALSSTGNFTTGVVSSLRGLRDAAGEIQITAPVQPGNSGGPVLDRSGVVIGVVQSKLDALWAVKKTGDVPQNVNFAVSLDVLVDFMTKNNVPIKSAARQVAIENTQVAEMAQSFTYKISCKAATKTAAKPKQQIPAPSQKPTPLPDKLVQDIQTALNQRGFNAGPADGVIGPRTKAAISSVQRVLGRVVNGLPSQALLAEIASSSFDAEARRISFVIGRVSFVFTRQRRFELELFNEPSVRVGDLVFIKAASVTARIDKIEGKFAFADVIEGNPDLIKTWAVIRKNN